MKVKVQCPCGTRFEFEVQPVNDRMPVAINCPVCNADATELANEIIRRQSAAPAVGITAAPVLPPTQAAPAPPPPAPSSGLRIAKSPSAHIAPVPAPAPVTPAETAAAAGTVQLCPKHKGEPAVDACVVCGKPLCLKCMEQFGHVCSVFCRQQAEQKRIYIPAYSGQRSVVEAKSNARAKLIALGVASVVLAFIGLWFYYAWFARDPKIVYTATLGDKNDTVDQRLLRPSEFFKLIGPNQLFIVKNKQASVLDITKNQTLWSTPLQSDSDSSSADKKTASGDLASEDDYNFSNPLVITTTNDLWLAFRDRVVRLDRQTGAHKDNPIHGRILSFSEQENSIVAVFAAPDGQRTLARVNLADGSIQTAPLGAPADAKPAVKAMAGKKLINTNLYAGAAQIKGDKEMEQVRAAAAASGRGLQAGIIAPDNNTIAPGGAPTEYLGELESYALNGGETPPFTASGPGVVQFQARLLEQKTVTRVAMKAKGKSVLDGNVTASQGLDLAQEMMNDAQRQRTGGVETEDVSRYQVTLHRLLGGDAPDWTGEVTGPPRFYALKTVDVVLAGQSVTAFDHNNKKLWDGKLSYPLNYLGDHPPVLETDDAVYVADPGVLTCFERASGAARWRLNSVGISAIRADARGKIYLATTDAGPDKIKYSQEHNVHEKIHPVIMKVDPATGKVLWRVESIGDNFLFSGKFLYTTWVTRTQSALKLEEGPDVHYNLDLLNPSSGSVIWNFHVDNQYIRQTEVQQNWILLRFADKLYVLKFFSL